MADNASSGISGIGMGDGSSVIISSCGGQSYSGNKQSIL